MPTSTRRKARALYPRDKLSKNAVPARLIDTLRFGRRLRTSGRGTTTIPLMWERGLDEGRTVLRRAGTAHGRGIRAGSQADGLGRPKADSLAHHALLRALRPHRVHPLSRAPGRRDQGLLP